MNRNAVTLAVTVALGLSACAVKTDGKCEIEADCAVGAQCVDNLCTGGAVPVASFTGPEEVDLGALVSLDGTGSARDDGSKDGLVYEWSLQSPQGVEFEGSADGATVSFRANVPHATYRIQLVTKDRGTPSTAIVREVKVRNSKPVATLSVEPTVWTRNTALTFDASQSSDPDGDALAYQWTLVKDPANVPGSIVPGDDGTATLMTADVAAKYTVTVAVSDGHGGSDDETLEQTLGNAPPTLDPGLAATVSHTCTAVTCSASFTLTGTATDVDGSINEDSVAWTLKSSPPAAEAGVVFQPMVIAGDTFSAAAKLSNEVPKSIVGDYVFELKAKDNDGDESKATVTITVGNEAPTIAFVEEAPHAPSVSHTFDSGKFVATVLPKVVVADADGDQLSIEFLDVVTTLPGATVTRAQGASPETASYEIAVEMANPTSLIDGTTPLYEIKAKVTDINGATAEATLPVVILNREPVIAGYLDGSPQVTAGHTWASGKYKQSFAVSGLSITDPDGDPLDVVWAHAGGPGDTELVAAGGTATAPATLTVSSADKSVVNANVTATATVSDAFGGSATGSKTLKMGNRLPTLTGLPSGQKVGHSYGLPNGVAGTTSGYSQGWNVTLSLVDPDGDPGVAITSWEASTATLTNANIQKLTVGAPVPTGITLFSTEKGIVGNDITLKANLSDGIATTVVSTTVSMTNRKPSIALPTFKLAGQSTATVTAYSCNGLKENQCASCNSQNMCLATICPVGMTCPPSQVPATWGLNTTHVTAEGGYKAFQLRKDVSVTDEDGDPVNVTYQIVGNVNLVNRFLDATGGAISSVSAVCGAGGSTGQVACAAKTTPFGFKSCGANTYTQVDQSATIKVTPNDGFEDGGFASRNVVRKNGSGGASCVISQDPVEL